MDARLIDNIEASNTSFEVTELITRWREIVQHGIYRMTGGRWKRYHEPKFLRNKRIVIEERLQQLTNNRDQGDLRQGIRPQHRGGFQPQPVTLNNGPILGDGPANPSPTEPN